MEGSGYEGSGLCYSHDCSTNSDTNFVSVVIAENCIGLKVEGIS